MRGAFRILGHELLLERLDILLVRVDAQPFQLPATDQLSLLIRVKTLKESGGSAPEGAPEGAPEDLRRMNAQEVSDRNCKGERKK